MGWVFFVLFTMVVTFIAVNLFVAIILDNFNESTRDSEKKLPKVLISAIFGILAF